MNIYHIRQSVVNGYDTYSDAVVIAATPLNAQTTHPSPNWKWVEALDTWRTVGWTPDEEDYDRGDTSWTHDYHDVTATLIGTAEPGLTPGVISRVKDSTMTISVNFHNMASATANTCEDRPGCPSFSYVQIQAGSDADHVSLMLRGPNHQARAQTLSDCINAICKEQAL